jgi:hypothetical protein
MTVKELKNILETISDDTEIVITCTDPTDFTYINDLDFTNEGYLWEDDGDRYIVDEEDIDEDEIHEYKKVFVIDGGSC